MATESNNYQFTGESGSGLDIRKWIEDETDLTHDSPFHTLGNGNTQAAAGNHEHDDDYMSKDGIVAGSNITFSTDSNGVITIHAADSASPISDHQALSNRGATNAHTIASVTNLQSTLDGKAATSHDHGGTYAAASHSHSYAAVSHSHSYAAVSHSHSYAAVSHGEHPVIRTGRVSGITLDGGVGWGPYTVAHGLGKTPVALFASPVYDDGVATVIAVIGTYDSVNLNIAARNVTANTTETFAIDWMVIG